jgi:ribonuclease HI
LVQRAAAFQGIQMSEIKPTATPISPHSPIWAAWFDGAAQPNPGPASIGAVLVGPGDETIEISETIGHGTNNEAEYRALVAVLEAAVARGITSLVVHGDSLLVVNQVNGDWDVSSANLKSHHQRAVTLASKIRHLKLVWIKRERNERADELSKRALGIKTYVDAEWGTQTAIGKCLGLSAVAVGRLLDAAGLRTVKKPSAIAIEQGVGRLLETPFGTTVLWHILKAATALRPASPASA